MINKLSSLNQSLFLHWVFKIRNLKSTLETLKKELGLKVLRHEEFNTSCEASCNGNFDNAWSKTMVGLGDELSFFALELVYNYSKNEDYKQHKGMLNLEFFSKNDDKNYKEFKMENYSMAKFNNFYCKEYLKILSNEMTENDFNHDFKFVTLEVNDLDKSLEYFTTILNMNVYTRDKIIKVENYQNVLNQDFLLNNQRNLSILGYAKDKTLLMLVQCENGTSVIQSEDSGRMAFACNVDVFKIKEKIDNFNEKILHQPVVLKTSGKADVKVIILLEKNEYEICFVEREGFRELSTLNEGVDFIDWELRQSLDKTIENMRSINNR